MASLATLCCSVLIFAVVFLFTNEAKAQRQPDYGLRRRGWTWFHWHYYWYYRHGKTPADIKEKETICQQLWNADGHRFHQHVDYDLRLQQKVPENSTQDQSNWPLVRYINMVKFRRIPTYDTFLDLISNFNPYEEGPKRLTVRSEDIKHNVERFVNETVKTRVFVYLYWYLVREGFLQPNKPRFKRDLYRIWFDNNNITHTHISGFENVFVGETVSNPRKLSFRNWLQFYYLERTTPYLNYFGYIRFYDVQPKILSVMYSWRYGSPVSDNMFVGTTPEFELAMYTLCYYISPGRDCVCKLNMRKIIVKTLLSENGSALQNAFFDIHQ